MPEVDELSDLFRAMNVDTTKPGFYDDPQFQARERRDPTFLENYAAFVDSRSYSNEYIETAKPVVSRAARFLHDRLVADGRLGACVDLSMFLSRLLEREGVWNYMVKGALTIEFADKSLETTYLAPITVGANPAVAGHVWVVAPPFQIVDLTVSRQPFEGRHADFLPPFVLAERSAMKEINPTVEDLMEPEARHQFRAFYGKNPSARDLEQMDPGLLDRARRMGCFALPLKDATLRYVACATSASDKPLEKIKSLSLSKKGASELYAEFRATPS